MSRRATTVIRPGTSPGTALRVGATALIKRATTAISPATSHATALTARRLAMCAASPDTSPATATRSGTNTRLVATVYI